MNDQLHKMLIPSDGTVHLALETLNRSGTGTLFAVDQDGLLCGVVTDGDIRRGLLAGATLRSPVREVMNSKYVVATQGRFTQQDLDGLDERIRYLPVVDERGAPVDFFLFEYRMHIPVAKPFLSGNEGRYVNECITTGWISSQGRFVKKFEEEFAAFCSSRHGIATCNGTAALHLALATLRVGRGDEVVVPSLTFAATVNAVLYTGATPVFADSNMETWGLDPESLARAITPRTKAVIPVHLYGQPAEMGPIMALSREHGLHVVEDAAEAHGATYRDRQVGSIGTLGCFSFFGNKILTTGEGGMVVTDDEGLANLARILRDHGMDPQRRYWHPHVGFNYRMTNLQAAVGCAQLERVEHILDCKRRIRDWYTRRLEDMRTLVFPPDNAWSRSVYWMYSILVDETRTGIGRDGFIAAFREHGIEVRPFFCPVHTMPPYHTGQTLPCAEYLSQTGINLPSYVGLTEDEVDRVCAVIRKVLGEAGGL